MYLVSLPTGQILWANRAFLDWSKYTLTELLSKSWMDISVNDGDLQADIKELETLNEYNTTYTVQKKYIPKGLSPQIGLLHVTRYPATGKIDFCWCRWEPFYNGTAKAFELAVKTQTESTAAINGLAEQFRIANSKTEEEKALTSVIGLARKYPKAAWFLFATAVLTLVGNNGAQLLKQFGLLTPERVQVVKEDVK
jgi:PAS domain-containing protein